MEMICFESFWFWETRIFSTSLEDNFHEFVLLFSTGFRKDQVIIPTHFNKKENNWD